jgi:hypothetical protein
LIVVVEWVAPALTTTSELSGLFFLSVLSVVKTLFDKPKPGSRVAGKVGIKDKACPNPQPHFSPATFYVIRWRASW